MHIADDWRADGYRWRQGGSNKVLVGAVTVHKRYFQIYDGPRTWSAAFTRAVYARCDRPNLVLIVYAGDETKAVDVPHGNAKSDRAKSRAYVRTQPHVLHDIRHQASTSSAPPGARAVYRDMVLAQPNGVEQELPRDMEQVGCCYYVKPFVLLIGTTIGDLE